MKRYTWGKLREIGHTKTKLQDRITSMINQIFRYLGYQNGFFPYIFFQHLPCTYRTKLIDWIHLIFFPYFSSSFIVHWQVAFFSMGRYFSLFFPLLLTSPVAGLWFAVHLHLEIVLEFVCWIGNIYLVLQVNFPFKGEFNTFALLLNTLDVYAWT